MPPLDGSQGNASTAVDGEPEARMTRQPTTFIVIPAYNEQQVIADVVKDVGRLAATVVVVDDASRDETASAARREGAVVLSHLLNRGQGAAIQTGFEYSLRKGAEIIVTFDADGQHTAADVPHLMRPIQQGDVDVVLGSRFMGTAVDISPARSMLLKVGVLLTRAFSGANVSDVHNGLRAFSAKAASRIALTQDRMAHASQILDQIVSAGLRYQEIPVQIKYTEYSRRKGQRTTAALRIAFDYFLGRVTKH